MATGRLARSNGTSTLLAGVGLLYIFKRSQWDEERKVEFSGFNVDVNRNRSARRAV